MRSKTSVNAETKSAIARKGGGGRFMFTPNLARNKSTFTKKGVCLNNFFDGFGIIPCASLFFPRLRTFSWRSRAEFDVYFVKDFPKVLKWSVCYAKRADATFFHSIRVYYASKTLLRSRFANLSYFS